MLKRHGMFGFQILSILNKQYLFWMLECQYISTCDLNLISFITSQRLVQRRIFFDIVRTVVNFDLFLYPLHCTLPQSWHHQPKFGCMIWLSIFSFLIWLINSLSTHTTHLVCWVLSAAIIALILVYKSWIALSNWVISCSRSFLPSISVSSHL